MSEYGSTNYQPTPIEALGVDRRARFIVRTYNHLFGAILAFVGLEVVLFQTGIAERIAAPMLNNWFLVLGAFMVVGWLASSVASRASSLSTQYAALAGFVAAEALIFAPILYIAHYQVGGGVIQSAGLVTLIAFAGLTAVAFMTRKDFSFMGAMLRWGGIIALVAIVAALLFGFHLGTWFSVIMVAFAGAAILYDTSNILHHYPEDRYVGAALGLFSSVALMFWYVLRIFMSRD
ncbi:permease [Acidobacteria bacterium Mor1]|nr:permease [Acidobacteria bacterium Mor1]